MTTQSKRFRIAAWALGLLLLFSCGLYLGGWLLLRDYDSRLDQWTATNGPIVELGDGAHNVPITPQAALGIGQPAVIGGLRVTVTRAGAVEDAADLHSTAVGYLYWRVKFTYENVSGEEQRPNPRVATQLQYEPHGAGYIRVLTTQGDCTPSLQNGAPALAPQASLVCDFVYQIPRGSQPLYWVFESGHNTIGEYAVFKVR